MRPWLVGLAVVGFALGVFWLRRDDERPSRPSSAPIAGEGRAEDANPELARGQELDAAESSADRSPAPEGASELPGARPEASANAERNSFLIAGSLSIDSQWVPTSHPRLVARRLVGSEWIEAAAQEIGAGEWTPLSVPWALDGTYQVRLEGFDLVPEERSFRAPEAGSTVRHEFEARFGSYQWYLVQGSTGNPIEGAEVQVSWRADGRWTAARGSSGADGHALVNGLPGGPAIARARMPGYVPVSLVELLVPADPPITYRFTLERAGVVRGRCVQDGEPVDEFTVGFWSASSGESTAVRTAFADRPDGSFELTEVPLGDVVFVASSSESPGCAPVSLTVTPETIGEVELELEHGLAGGGTAVDADSAEPLSNATVQMMVGGQAGPVMRWGVPVEADARGRLTVGSLRLGQNWVLISAPDHAPTVVRHFVGEPADTDLGVVPLQRLRPIELVLAGAEPASAAGYYVFGTGPSPLPAQRFAEEQDGRLKARYDVGPGRYHVKLVRPDWSIEEVFFDFSPEVPATLTFLADGGGTLDVTVLADRSALEKELWVTVSTLDGGLNRLRSMALSARAMTVEHVEPGRVDVEIRDAANRTLALVQADVRAGATTSVTLALGDSRLLGSVVDAKGEPLAGVEFSLHSADDPHLPWYRETTNSEGEADLGFVPPGEYVAHLAHPTLGRRFNVPVSVAGTEDERVALELAAEADLTLQFVDGDLPIPHAGFQLVGPLGALAAEPSRTDEGGRAVLNRLAPSTVRVRTLDDRLWPTTETIPVGSASVSASVEVRRLGDLELLLHAESGLPVSGLAIDLVSLELEARVADWLAAGLVDASAAALTTDLKGRLVLRGLPHGAYSWSLSAGGEPFAGEAVVKPGTSSSHSIVVP